MKTCKIFLFLLALPILVCAQNNADNSSDLFDLSLEQLMNLQVTTATKTAGKSDAVPAVIEIITSEQIKARGYQHLAHILNDIGNNHEDRTNWGIGEPTNQNVGFGFRFDTGQNMLILFNGQRLNAFLPGNRFGGEEYLLNNIDRVEIIRGPGSALYGTGAFTCVVNIITKKLSGKSADEIIVSGNYVPTSKGVVINNAATLSVGKQGTLSTAFRYQKEEGQKLAIKNSLFGDAELKDGVNHAIDGELFFNSGSLNIFSKISNQSRKTLTGFNGVNPTNMDELNLDMYAYSLGLDKSFKVGQKSEIKISGGWHQDNWTEVALIPQFKVSADGSHLLVDDKGNAILDTLSLYRNGEQMSTSFFIDGQGADTRSLDAEIQFTSNYSRNNNIVFGVYVSDDKILNAERPTELNLSPLEFVPFRNVNDAPNNWLFDLNASRKTLAAFAQMDFNVNEKLNLAAGLRLDSYSGTGLLEAQKYNEVNPRASVVYQLTERGTIKLLYGTATRIPNGFETLSSVSILGDPNNRPERIRTYQLQWINNWSANFRTELGGFRSAISNRLETNASISDNLRAQGYIGQFINTDAPNNQVNNGLDGKIISRINASTFALNFTQYFGSDDGHGNSIAYIPNTMVNLDYNLKLKNVNVNTGFNYRGGFTKSVQDTREPVKNYLVGRLNILYQPTRSPIEYMVSLRNIFNTKYYYPSSSVDFPEHFPARGVEVSIGFIYKPSLQNL
jgi:outer membrane receptor for ferrienterochelin and colicins